MNFWTDRWTPAGRQAWIARQADRQADRQDKRTDRLTDKTGRQVDREPGWIRRPGSGP